MLILSSAAAQYGREALPYTGFDLKWLIVVAIVLILVGLALRKRQA